MAQQLKHQSVVDISGEACSDSQAAISENKFRSLFEASPVSLCEQDFSGVKQFIDQLCQQGITDFRAYFEAHPEDVTTCLSLIKVNNANQVTPKLYKAADQAALLNHLEKVTGAEEQLRQQLQEAELLREILAINPTVDTLNDAFTLICEKLAAFYQVPSVSFTLLDKEAMFADIIGEYLDSALDDCKDAVTPLPNIVSIDTLLQQKTIEFVPTVQKAARFEQARDILQAFANHSSLLVPVAAPIVSI